MGDEDGASEKGRGLLKLKIAKKAYVFDVRKKYAAVRTFNVKKKPETPAEGIIQNISSLLKKRRPGEEKEKAPAAKPSGQNLLSTTIKIAAGLLALFFLAIAFVWISVSASPAQQAPALPPSAFSGTLNFSINGSDILSVGSEQSPKYMGYMLLDYSSQGLSALNFSAYLYQQKPPTQVFVLDYLKEGADTYPEFLSGLKQTLGIAGISVNEIGLESLQTLPGGSVLLVPTGYFPEELLDSNSSTYYGNLLSRGVTIIYIGDPFDNLALDGQASSTISVNEPELTFSTSNIPESSGGFNLYDPQYSVAVSQAGASEGFSGGTPLYGSVSVIHRGTGTMLFIPQQLDLGWISDTRSTGTEKAVNDVSRIVEEDAWNPPFAGASELGNVSGNGANALSLYTAPPFGGSFAYAEVAALATDSKGLVQQGLSTFRLNKGQESDIVPLNAETVPYYLIGEDTRLDMVFHEANQTPVQMYVVMYKDGTQFSRSNLENQPTAPVGQKSINFEVDALPGNYVVMVEDGNGRVYAATELSVADLDIAVNTTTNEWQTGKFVFLLSSAGSPVFPQSLTVSMDGNYPETYSPSTLALDGASTALEYDYPGKISAGAHDFTFTVGSLKKDVRLQYTARKEFWDNPMVIVLGFVSLLVFGLGTILRRPEALRYGLDIPDFPPLSTIKIPIKRETVLEIFDNVNMRYNWKWMPLRLDEIKSGFGKLTYNGKPILVGDFNLDRILSKMREEGTIRDELDYWGRADWEKESGHSLHYLAVYRILRNVFVNNAVKFSKLDTMPDCDVKAIIGKEELYLHIMEEPKERVVHRALGTASKGPTMIVFRSEEEIEKFKPMLTSTSRLAVALKMEVNNHNIMLLPVKVAISAYLKQKSL